MKILKVCLVFVLTLMASAVSAQTNISLFANLAPATTPSLPLPPKHRLKNPYAVGPATFPYKYNLYSSKASPSKAIRAIKKLPDMKMSNRHYHLDCFEKTPGACNKIWEALKKAK